MRIDEVLKDVRNQAFIGVYFVFLILLVAFSYYVHNFQSFQRLSHNNTHEA